MLHIIVNFYHFPYEDKKKKLGASNLGKIVLINKYIQQHSISVVLGQKQFYSVHSAQWTFDKVWRHVLLSQLGGTTDI